MVRYRMIYDCSLGFTGEDVRVFDFDASDSEAAVEFCKDYCKSVGYTLLRIELIF